MTELKSRNEYMERKLAYCLEVMMERGVNINWASVGMLTQPEDPKNMNRDEEDYLNFGRDFHAIKAYTDRNVESEAEKLKIYLNKVLKRCERLESKCSYLEDLREQTKVLAEQPGSKSIGALLHKSGENEAQLIEELRSASAFIKELQTANEKMKSELIEEHKRMEEQQKELEDLWKIYGKKKKPHPKNYEGEMVIDEEKSSSESSSSSSDSSDSDDEGKKGSPKVKDKKRPKLIKSVDVKKNKQEKEEKKLKKRAKVLYYSCQNSPHFLKSKARKLKRS